MKVVIGSKVYDSAEEPILLIFDEDKERDVFKLKRFVSAPGELEKQTLQDLIDLDVSALKEES